MGGGGINTIRDVPMWRDGSLLVVRKGEAFPDRCIKSNQPAHGRRVKQVAEQGWSTFAIQLPLGWSPIPLRRELPSRLA
jgi:hypothetical protein